MKVLFYLHETKKKIDIIKLNEMKLSFCSQKKEKKKISHIFFPESIVYIFFAESISTIVRVYIRFFLLISRFHFAPQNTWNTLYIRKQWSLVIMEKKKYTFPVLYEDFSMDKIGLIKLKRYEFRKKHCLIHF